MRFPKSSRGQRGASLIEMMIALVVLTIGLLGSMALVGVAINGDYRSKNDSTSTALAEMVAAKISAVPVCSGSCGAAATVTVTDCTGTVHNINVTDANAGSGTGANLTSSGSIDYSQAFGAVTSKYAMDYVVCGVENGLQTTYDVRWNVKLLPSKDADFVVVGAQMATGSNSKIGTATAPAVNVRTIAGNDGN